MPRRAFSSLCYAQVKPLNHSVLTGCTLAPLLCRRAGGDQRGHAAVVRCTAHSGRQAGAHQRRPRLHAAAGTPWPCCSHKYAASAAALLGGSAAHLQPGTFLSHSSDLPRPAAPALPAGGRRLRVRGRRPHLLPRKLPAHRRAADGGCRLARRAHACRRPARAGRAGARGPAGTVVGRVCQA